MTAPREGAAGPALARLSPLPFASLVLAGLAVRLFLAFRAPLNFDQVSFRGVADIVWRSGNIYAETPRYNYTPVFAQLLFLLDWLAVTVGVPLYAVVRSFLSLVDLGTAAAIGGIAGAIAAGSGRAAFLAYWLSPVAILLVGAHGQFETLAALPFLLATLVWLRWPSRPVTVPVWGLVTLSLVVKHIFSFSVLTLLVYAVPSLLAVAALLLASLVVFLSTFVPYLPEGAGGIFWNVFLYFGFQQPFSPFSRAFPPVALPAFVLVMLAVPLVAKKLLRLPPVPALELSVVAFLFFAPSASEQYFLLPAALGAVRRGPFWLLFTGVTTYCLLGSRDNVHLFDNVAGLVPVWIAVAAWFVSLLAGRGRGGAAPAAEGA